ncbi:MAG: hypothetical protein ACRC9K_13530 [Afipia sp.]
MTNLVMRRLILVAVVTLAMPRCVQAHGIAGNRFFPGTLTFDDPAVADEAILPAFSNFKHPVEGGNVVDNRLTWSFVRLLTPTIGLGVDSGWVHRNWGTAPRSGFDVTNLTIKGQVYRDNPHEALIAASLTWGIGHSGAQGIGANTADSIQPGIFFGKGFGDLPDSFSWLRPFGVTGAISMQHPLGVTSSTNFGLDPTRGLLASVQTRNVDTLRWGFSLQYSTLYLTKRFTGGPPKEEPLNQFVPLIEFAFDSPRGAKTVATMNPGLSYAAVTWQVAVEAIVPLNRDAGRSVGGRAQMLFFLDDLIPTVFGKPLLSH